MKRGLVAFGLSSALLLASGCASTTLRSGKPPGQAAPGYDRRWHASFLFGAVSFRDDYELSQICKHGWAEVKMGPDAFTALTGLLTAFIYSPSRLTVVCATESEGPPALPTYGERSLRAP